jgi:hypothetical protein
MGLKFFPIRSCFTMAGPRELVLIINQITKNRGRKKTNPINPMIKSMVRLIMV